MAEYIESSSVHAVAAAPVSRRERKKGRTRADIYNAAMNLFVRRGFDSVTIEDICDAADVARATFFLHFPAKEALLIEYGERANDELAAAIAEYRGSATATIRMALKMLAERAVRHPDVVRLVMREMLARPRVLSEHDEKAAGLVDLLAGIIRRGQKSRRVSAADGADGRGADCVLGVFCADLYVGAARREDRYRRRPSRRLWTLF